MAASCFYEDENDNYNYESGQYATIPINWNEAAKTLTIGRCQGGFPGMLTDRTFKVVWVSSGHGVGITNTVEADGVIHYTGSATNIVCP